MRGKYLRIAGGRKKYKCWGGGEGGKNMVFGQKYLYP
jgi:hypothetical protein